MATLNGGSDSDQLFGLDRFTAVSASGEPQLGEEDEELAASFQRVVLAVGEDSREQGTGTLYVTTRQIIWCKSLAGGFSVPFDRISMHAMLDADIFQRMCDCAALNPDSDMEGDAEGNDEFYYNEEEVLAGAGADDRARTLESLDSMLQLEDGVEDEDEMADGDLEAHDVSRSAMCMQCWFIAQTRGYKYSVI
ncbi:hypothetical protein WJX84_001854 [Apatococcus fuscideae]|uniref:Chloride conductance regulatory protein ICln n=1 Tax=Apatococcus fuscideae TaxID=2026836 RepID=A0AAW1SPM3_9CHLO